MGQAAAAALVGEMTVVESTVAETTVGEGAYRVGDGCDGGDDRDGHEGVDPVRRRSHRPRAGGPGATSAVAPIPRLCPFLRRPACGSAHTVLDEKVASPRRDV